VTDLSTGHMSGSDVAYELMVLTHASHAGPKEPPRRHAFQTADRLTGPTVALEPAGTSSCTGHGAGIR
jgi:hypothetical protein